MSRSEPPAFNSLVGLGPRIVDNHPHGLLAVVAGLRFEALPALFDVDEAGLAVAAQRGTLQQSKCAADFSALSS